jgi:thioredoxin reductase
VQTLVLFIKGEASDFFLFGVLKCTYDSGHKAPDPELSHIGGGPSVLKWSPSLTRSG